MNTSMTNSRRGILASTAAIVALISAAPVLGRAGFAPAGAQSAFPPPWSSGTLCVRGTLQCVDGVVAEMRKRLRGLAERCDHDAVFALLYLRTTEEYQRTVAADPAFFVDTAYVNREDAMFADDYFGPYDAWHAGAGGVPPAWAIAFEAAERREVSGSGNTLLGMNAHINRDLPFVLARLGLTHPDGSSRKPDHDKVNQILRVVAHGPVLDEAAGRFDPSMRNSDIPGTTLDNEAFYQLVVLWRERAWHNAVRLLTATSTIERQLIAADIEQSAAAQALAIKASAAYTPPVSSTDFRDAYCAAQ
jgi:hypothetical protein